jgi:hypothetical protein
METQKDEKKERKKQKKGIKGGGLKTIITSKGKEAFE